MNFFRVDRTGIIVEGSSVYPMQAVRIKRSDKFKKFINEEKYPFSFQPSFQLKLKRIFKKIISELLIGNPKINAAKAEDWFCLFDGCYGKIQFTLKL